MRTAVVLTGHLRCWEKVFANFKSRIIDQYNPDIFISTWDNEGYWIPGERQNGIGVYEHSPKLDIQKVYDTYKPKALEVQCWDDYKDYFRSLAELYPNYLHRPENILSMFWKIQRGVNLISNFDHYNLVIRMRPDIVFHHDLPNFTIVNNNVYTINHKNHLNQGTGDLFQAGSPKILEYLSNCFVMIPRIYNNITNILCPHLITQYIFNNMDINEFYINKTIMHTPNGEYKENYNEN